MDAHTALAMIIGFDIGIAVGHWVKRYAGIDKGDADRVTTIVKLYSDAFVFILRVCVFDDINKYLFEYQSQVIVYFIRYLIGFNKIAEPGSKVAAF